MVIVTDLIQTVVRQLEKYIIWKSGFSLDQNFELILFVPTDKYSVDSKYSLIISAKILDKMVLGEAISELFADFRKTLTVEEYNSIWRINVIRTQNTFVRNLKHGVFSRERIIEIHNASVGETELEYAIIVNSRILDKLKPGKVVHVQLFDGRNISAKIIEVDHDFNVVYYTEKWLNANLSLWKATYNSSPADTSNVREPSADYKQKKYVVDIVNIAKISLDDISEIV